MADHEIVIDPQFFKPPGVVDLRDPNQEDGSEYYAPNDYASGEVTMPATTVNGTPVAPSTMTIAGQTIRQTAVGSPPVVDVVVELPDASGITYEVRITKL